MLVKQPQVRSAQAIFWKQGNRFEQRRAEIIVKIFRIKFFLAGLAQAGAHIGFEFVQGNRIALVLLLTPAFYAQQSVPEIPFDSVPNFLKLPAELHLGEASGVAVNSKGHVFVFSRGNTTGPAYAATASQIVEFGADGKYIREIGHNLYAWSFAHTVRVDKDDNIWAVDKGSDMIVKFNPEGRVVMVFGRKKEASDDGAEAWKRVNPPRTPVDGQFRQPTDVTWDTQGNIFISDGYINSRVAKFDKNGDWVKSFG